MFTKQRMDLSDEQEEILSDKIALAVGDSKNIMKEVTKVSIYRPDMKVLTGGKSYHLYLKRLDMMKEGFVYNMNSKGVAEAKFSYVV